MAAKAATDNAQLTSELESLGDSSNPFSDFNNDDEDEQESNKLPVDRLTNYQ